jgi:hypothetical protein
MNKRNLNSKPIHIWVHPLFYQQWESEKRRTQLRLHLNHEISHTKFSEMWIKSYNRLPPFKLRAMAGGRIVKGKKR